MKTCPELAKILAVDDTVLRYHLTTDPKAPPFILKKGKTGSDAKYYNESLVVAWWEIKSAERVKRVPLRKNPRPSYNSLDVASWCALMRNNKWSVNKLSNHLGIGFATVTRYLDDYYAGFLK